MSKVMWLTGATVWAEEDGTARVVPWKRHFTDIQAAHFGCVPAPDKGWNRYEEADRE